MDRVELRCDLQLKAVLMPTIRVVEVRCHVCRKDGREPVHWFDSTTGERLTAGEVQARRERIAA